MAIRRKTGGDQFLIDTSQETMSFENSASPTRAHSPGAVLPRQLPPIFQLHAVPFTRTFLMGDDRENAVYAVSTHSGQSGNPDVVLHTGVKKSDPILAAAEVTHTIPTTLTVNLPSRPGSPHQTTVEPITIIPGLSRRYHFGIEVDPAGTMREEFEWRHSSGSVVKEYGAARQGWKLMRLSKDPPGSYGGFSSPGALSFKSEAYESSDGKEIVAVWANTGSSMLKSWRFAFIGTGATGILGERWALMAVMSALLMWEQERRARSTDAGS